MFVCSLRTRFAVSFCLLLQAVSIAISEVNGASTGSSTSTHTLSPNGNGSLPGLSDEIIYNDLISGKRQILAAGMLSVNLILVIGQLDGNEKLTQVDDIYVYDIPVPVSTYSKLHLFGGLPLQTRWPHLHQKLDNKTRLSMFVLGDSKHHYLMVFYESNGKEPFAFNVDEQKGFEMKNIDGNNAIGKGKIMISTVTPLRSANIDLSEHNLYVRSYDFTDSEQIDADKSKMELTEKYFVCSQAGGNSTDEVVKQKEKCASGSELNWTIQNGFVDNSRATLFTKEFVYRISNFASTNASQPVNVEKIKLSDFFVLGNNTVVSTKAGGLSLGIIIGIVVLGITLILVCVVVLFCCCASGSKKRRPKRSKSRKSSRKGSRISSRKASSKRASSRGGRSNLKGRHSKSRRPTAASTRRSSLRKPSSRHRKRTSAVARKPSRRVSSARPF